MDVLGSLEDVKSMLHKRFLHDLKEKNKLSGTFALISLHL